jgi:hypothetical protein
MREGSFVEAARSFESEVRASPKRYSVQVLVACSTETIQKALDSVAADELFILPVSFRGRSCYRVCWGLYDSEAGAQAALQAMPQYFREGGATPRVSPTAGILP